MQLIAVNPSSGPTRSHTTRVWLRDPASSDYSPFPANKRLLPRASTFQSQRQLVLLFFSFSSSFIGFFPSILFYTYLPFIYFYFLFCCHLSYFLSSVFFFFYLFVVILSFLHLFFTKIIILFVFLSPFIFYIIFSLFFLL